MIRRPKLCSCALLLALVPSCAQLLGLEEGTLPQVGGAGAGGAMSLSGAATTDAGASTSGTKSEGGSASPIGGESGESLGGSASDAGGPSMNAAGEAGSGVEPADAPNCVAGACKECRDDMLQVTSSDQRPFCIDVRETTNADYRAFVASAAKPANGAECVNNKSFVPASACAALPEDAASQNLPVVCVDYCDAAAYCSYRGKRLCGHVGGGMNPVFAWKDAKASEWFAACTGPALRAYPYGAQSSASACNGAAAGKKATEAVGTRATCNGGFDGLLDMSGNVWEWERSCDSELPEASCSARGGSFETDSMDLRCDGYDFVGRLTASRSIGIRCCADLAP